MCVMRFALSFLMASALAGSAAEPISFGKLAKGESILVRLSSRGCFDNESSYEFEFGQSTATRVKITRLDKKPHGASEEKRTVLGTFALPDGDVPGLDLLLNYYRGGNGDTFCTSTDTIVVTLKAGDGVKASETFTDNTADSRTMKKLTTFWSLLQRVPELR